MFVRALWLTLPLLISTVSLAQTEVKVGPGGVRVKTDGAEVEAGGGKTVVKTGGAAVEADEDDDAPASPSAKSEPVSCKDNEELTLENLKVSAKGFALVAEGNCTLVLKNSTLESTAQALRIVDNATVTLVNVTVLGKKGAVVLANNATLTIEGCTVTGPIKKSDNATLNKKGDKNVLKKK
jgi:hypothetical protein